MTTISPILSMLDETDETAAIYKFILILAQSGFD